MSVTYFKIPLGETGAFGLTLVDRDAVGYEDDWQAPGGKDLTTVLLADYDTGSTSWQCQVTASALTATSNVNTTDRAGTLCVAPSTSTTVAQSTFQIELGYFQDANNSTGLTAYLFEHETKEAFVYFGADGDDPPRAIGRVRLTSGNIGGDTWVDGLTAEATFPFIRKPDLEVGNATTSRIILGTPAAAVTAAAPTQSDEELATAGAT